MATAAPPARYAPGHAPALRKGGLPQSAIDSAVAPFLLTDGEVEAMARAIYTARVDAYVGAYQEAMASAGLPIDLGYEIPAEAAAREADDALAAARSIAATYERDLRAAAARLGGADGATAASVRGGLSDWATARKGWKTEQISAFETGVAADRGTMQFLTDLTSGELNDVLEELDGWVDEEISVAVLPAGAETDDLCLVYAGWAFPIEAAWDIPDFPLHGNCPHEKVVLYGGVDEIDLDPEEAAEMSPGDWGALLSELIPTPGVGGAAGGAAGGGAGGGGAND